MSSAYRGASNYLRRAIGVARGAKGAMALPKFLENSHIVL